MGVLVWAALSAGGAEEGRPAREYSATIRMARPPADLPSPDTPAAGRKADREDSSRPAAGSDQDAAILVDPSFFTPPRPTRPAKDDKREGSAWGNDREEKKPSGWGWLADDIREARDRKQGATRDGDDREASGEDAEEQERADSERPAASDKDPRIAARPEVGARAAEPEALRPRPEFGMQGDVEKRRMPEDRYTPFRDPNEGRAAPEAKEAAAVQGSAPLLQASPVSEGGNKTISGMLPNQPAGDAPAFGIRSLGSVELAPVIRGPAPIGGDASARPGALSGFRTWDAAERPGWSERPGQPGLGFSGGSLPGAGSSFSREMPGALPAPAAGAGLGGAGDNAVRTKVLPW